MVLRMEVSILFENQLNLETYRVCFFTQNENCFIESPGLEGIFITATYISKF